MAVLEENKMAVAKGVLSTLGQTQQLKLPQNDGVLDRNGMCDSALPLKGPR